MSAETPVKYPKMLPMRAERNIRPVAVVEKLYGSLVMISETAKPSVSISIGVDVCARYLY